MFIHRRDADRAEKAKQRPQSCRATTVDVRGLLQKQVTAPADIPTSIDAHLKTIAGTVKGLAATNERLRKQYRQQCEAHKRSTKHT